MKVYKKIAFDAAHWLPNYEGRCHNLHGHRWEIEIGFDGPVDSATGFVTDFIDLKRFLEEEVEKRFDHSLLNDIIRNPTAENLVQYIRDNLETYSGLELSDRLRPCSIRVWESPDSYAEETW